MNPAAKTAMRAERGPQHRGQVAPGRGEGAEAVVGRSDLAPQERGQPGEAAHLQLADLPVAHGAHGAGCGRRRPSTAPRWPRFQVHARDEVGGLAEPAADEGEEDLDQREDHAPGAAPGGGGPGRSSTGACAPGGAAGAGGGRPRGGARPRASRWRATAAGTITTRAPARWARQHRSRSSPWKVMPGSKPSRVANRSARTRVHAAGDVEDVAHRVVLLLVELAPLGRRGGRRRSCRWPRPTARSRPGSCQSTSLGPRMPALERNASSTRWRTASGARATSSWHSRKKAAPSTGIEHPVGGGAEAGAALLAGDAGVGEHGGDPRGRVLGAAGVDDQDRHGPGRSGRRGTAAPPRTRAPGSQVTTTATTAGRRQGR